MEDEGLSEYEKQRLARISENRARLEALGIPLLASSVLASSSKQQPQKKSKGKHCGGAGDKGDDEYKPSDDDDGDTEEDQEGESSFDEEEGEEDDARASSGSRRKGKKRSSLITAKSKKIPNARKNLDESDIFDDEAALKKAIALSLGATIGGSAGISVEVSQSYANEAYAQDEKDKAKTQRSARRKKARKLNKARVQLSEDEVVAFFFSFDETGKGYITPRDVKKMVTSHDFSWTDTEIAHMIHSFDSGGDGKLSLEDFRSIVTRCKMLQGTEEC